MNVLVVAPHPDDESIGCGGAISKHSLRGDRVVAAFLTSGELGLKHLPRERAWKIREAEACAAARILGLAEVAFFRGPDWGLADHIAKVACDLRSVLERERPQLIYLPHPLDSHPDHIAAIRILRAGLKSNSAVPELRGYEVWSPLSRFDHTEDITSTMNRKLRAIRAHRSQLKEFDYACAIRGLNEYRGVLAGKCRFAEVFQSLEPKVAR